LRAFLIINIEGVKKPASKLIKAGLVIEEN